jgi:Tol biopolymer transport system component
MPAVPATSLPRVRAMPIMRGVLTSIRLTLLAATFALLTLGAGKGSAVLPGENGKLAFASSRDGNFEVYVTNPDTTGQARLTRDPASDGDPAWSADGTRIAFTSNRDGNDELYLMTADGSGQTRLTTSPGSDTNATWSPGGRNLAFASTREGDAEIFVMNEDGTGQSALTQNDAADATPAWSPDAARIAFRSERDGNSEIYVLDVDGTNQTRLTASPGADVSPAWSPDGRRIAFASERDGNWEIYVMNADGSGQTRLTRNVEIDLDPAWSPDGRLLAFTTNRDGNYEIYVMNADGSGQTRLTTNGFEDTTADWQWQRLVLPPPEAVTAASFRVRWRESRVLGVLQVTGRVPGVARIQVALRRGKRVHLAAGLTLARGAFRKRLALPRDLPPGRFALEVTAVGSPTELTAQTLALRLAPPPEGVVSQTWASATVGGPPLERVPASNSIAFAHFRFTALPRPGRTLVSRWYVNGRAAGKPVPKPRRSLVIAWAEVEGAPLPRGRYSCVLRAGTTVVKRLSFRVT